jgi:VIT1/CCC1 family predicted Fe2+/Mn2+ transporter
MADEEKSARPQQYLTGFGSFANFISSDSDHATAVYKTFDKLTARDLLYYEAELLELEALQDQFDHEDATDVDKVDSFSPEWFRIRQNARDWSSFKQSSQEPSAAGARWKRRMDLAMQIRATLKEYREALVANAKVLSLSRPSKQTMTALSHTFHQRLSSSNDSSEADAVLMGHGSHLYPLLSRRCEQPHTDHISLKSVPEPDFLTFFLKTYCSRLFKVRHRAPSHGLTHMSTPEVRHSIERINFAASFITTVLSALLLFLPIYVLYHMSSSKPGLTLGLIALFTCLFAATIALVTNARRAEIFGSCAAYAAVLVVFVSGDFANGSNVGPND